MTSIETEQTSPIVLATINARYIHSSFGLRYIKANMGELEAKTAIEEFTLESRPEDIAERLLSLNPQVLTVSIYIWNTVQSLQLIALIRELRPDLPIIIGGPEVSYEVEGQPVFALADYVVTGWGDISVPKLCKQLLEGERPKDKIITGEQPKLCEIKMPYHLYTDEDIKNRVIYVEASRGCPYKCEFCLSALDKTAWPFDTDLFLAEMEKLYLRGARQFKFVDRTFNLNIKVSLRILDFFLERMDDDMFLHFELIPDHLPDALKETIKKFPPKKMQFEIGIQTFNEEVQKRISRRQKNGKAEENLAWLREETDAYIHADLIFGLPGETVEQFSHSFNRLYDLRPHEIQVGILKRLKGSPIIRHSEEYELKFNPSPPFSILSHRDATFFEMQGMIRFARYWDMLGNSGRFTNSLPLLLIRLINVMYDIGIDSGIDKSILEEKLTADFEASGQKSLPAFMQRAISERKGTKKDKNADKTDKGAKRNARQARH